jgi:hypothetical protein
MLIGPLFNKLFIRIKVWIRRHIKSIKQLAISNIRWNCIILMSIAIAITWCPSSSSSSVVLRKLFQRSSPLKPLDQLEPNLVWIITRVSTEHVCSLNFTYISYGFWNKGRNVLTFSKFDEKRAITSRFSAKLQGCQILMCWSFIRDKGKV